MLMLLILVVVVNGAVLGKWDSVGDVVESGEALLVVDGLLMWVHAMSCSSLVVECTCRAAEGRRDVFVVA